MPAEDPSAKALNPCRAIVAPALHREGTTSRERATILIREKTTYRARATILFNEKTPTRSDVDHRAVAN